jgi:GDPmannose 4,6-dehydratase
MNGDRVVENPVERNNDRMFGLEFEKTRIDELMLAGELEFEIQERGIWVYTNKGKIPIESDADRFRSAEVPILLSSCQKIGQLGFEVEHKLDDIITDQLDFYLEKDRRSL